MYASFTKQASWERFYFAGHHVVRIGLGVVGPGLIGREFLNQLKTRTPVLSTERNLDIALVGVARSSKMVVAADKPIAYEAWEDALQTTGAATDLGECCLATSNCRSVCALASLFRSGRIPLDLKSDDFSYCYQNR